MNTLLNIWNDVRYAARRLRLSPGFTVAAVATIALGIGINTGIFSILNGVALRSLPVPDADELVSIHQVIEGEGVERNVMGARSMFSTAEYHTYRDQAQTLSGIVGYSGPRTVTLGGQIPREIVGTFVTCNYFDVLRQPLAIGKGFGTDYCESSLAEPTVVLGYDLWVTLFNADPTVIGRQLLLNRQAFVVVGVASNNVRGLDIVPVSFFAPISTQPLLRPNANSYLDDKASWLTMVGRRKIETTLEQVRVELGVIAAQIDLQQPPRKTRLNVARARPLSLPEARPVLIAAGSVVMTAFGLVLLIACANVANLFLARTTARRREIAVRFALGASRPRVLRQLLAESVLIALAGGFLGAILALWSSQSLVALALSALPPEVSGLAIDTSPDVRVLLYAFVLSLVTAALFGVAPAVQASKPELHAAMKADGVGGAPRQTGGLQRALVGAQVAVCMVLMVAAGLLLRGLHAAQTVEPGFDYDNVLVASFDLDGAGYDASRSATFQRQLKDRISSLPGINEVAQAINTPLSLDDVARPARLPGQDQWFPIRFNSVSPEFFSLLGIPIVLGRTFVQNELQEGSTAAIVTETTARRYWPQRDPVGQTLALMVGPDQTQRDYRIVGVAKDAQITSIGEVTSDFVYVPSIPQMQSRLQLLARSRIDSGTTASAIRGAITDLDPALVPRVAPLEANLDAWRSLAGLVSTLSTSLGALALILAAVGVCGVVAHVVGTRVREIGIRIALGATAWNVLGFILRRTMLPVGIGAIIGIAGAAAVSRVLSGVLFGISPVDPIALAGSAVFVVGTALTAAVLTARPATRANPTATLRYE